MERITIYVDGFNFYYGLKRQKKIDKDWKKFYWIDFVKLFEQFLGENQVLEKVIYFTATPLNVQKAATKVHCWGLINCLMAVDLKLLKENITQRVLNVHTVKV